MARRLTDNKTHKTVCLEDVSLLRESSRAILVKYRGDTQWIPKSQIHKGWGIPWEPNENYLVLTKWIAERKGWD